MAKNKRSYFFDIKPTIQGINIDLVLASVVGVLLIFGLAFFASSLSTFSREVYFSEFFKQLFLGIGLGIVACIIMSQVDYHFLLKKSGWFVLLNFLLLGFLAAFAIYISLLTWGDGAVEVNNFRINLMQQVNFSPVAPHAANGAIRWLDLGFVLKFQPSEFTKIAMLLYFSWYLLKFDNKDNLDTWEKLKRPIYALAISCGMILLQPDLGTVILILAIIFSSMWVAKVDRRFLALLATLGLLLVVVLTVTTGYRLERVLAVVNPQEAGASTDQIDGVKRAITNGGVWGVGYGQSEFKRQSGVLFEESTDAIIAVIAEEMGFVLTLIFLSLYLVLLLRGLRIAQRAPDIGGKALATGITVWLVSQAFLNITGITGITPLTGIPLPFVSKGGSAMLINLLAVGILLNISSQEGSENKQFKKKNFA
jgi:cell division protein FtsW